MKSIPCCNKNCAQGDKCPLRPFAPGVIEGPHRSGTSIARLLAWFAARMGK